MTRSAARGFTIVELLVVVSIIALLIGILLPAIGKARDQAKLTQSQTNLRQLGQAHVTYSSEWNDRQLTMVDDNWGRYGSSGDQSRDNYEEQSGSAHPGVFFGWANTGNGGTPAAVGYWFGGHPGYLLEPMNFQGGSEGFGWFRYYNVKAFNRYLNDRYYDLVFYAPKDRVVMGSLEDTGCLEDPGEFCFTENALPRWSSYCLSPAALYSPSVMSNPNQGGFKDPYSLDAGFRAPAMSQARYPDLKTHMTEHHWLQQTRADCNPSFDSGSGAYDCEPYYFNHSWESVPVTLFYDGHVEGLGVRAAEAADSRHAVQAGYGLWSRDTPLGSEGYFIDSGYDFANTSFHILTTDGIRGRDKISN
jgi:prepilin-type N-terminal cleavage/methylation domain-containing protein